MQSSLLWSGSKILVEMRCARDFVVSVVSLVVSHVVSFSQILPILGEMRHATDFVVSVVLCGFPCGVL